MIDQLHNTRNALGWLGLAGMAAVVVLRCLAVMAPQTAFEVDPAIDASVFTGIGPAGSMILDCVLLFFAAIALFGEVRTCRGIDWTLVVFALIPSLVIGWHGWFDLGDLWRGSTWISGMIAGVAAAHLARDPKMRILMVALLIGVAGPLLARGFMQMTVEHAATVEEYERIKPQMLLSRGWEPDSSQARIFERRLYEPRPTGWFLTTNVFASFMAVSLVCWLSWTIAAIRRRMVFTWGVCGGAMTIASLAGLIACQSKGAIAAGMLGVIVLLVTRWKMMHFPFVRKLMPAALMLLAGAVLLAIVVRGALLSESFLGEKSLLFRWHYMQGAAAIIGDHFMAGVGPDGFQQAYLMARPVRSPEEVVSSHNVFIDWLAMLGIGGAVWIALTAVLAWRIGSSAGERIELDEPIPVLESERKRDIAIIGVVTLAAAGGAMLIERAALTIESEIARVVGCLLFFVIAAAAWRLMREQRESERRIMQLAIAAVLIVHAQIEMTFFEAGSAAWCMMLLGALSSAKSPPSCTNRESFCPLLILVLAGFVAWFGARPMWKQSVLMEQAAALLRGREADVARATELLQQAWAAGGQRDHRPIEQAVKQRLRSAAGDFGDRQIEQLSGARAMAQQALDRHGRTSTLSMLGGIDATLWRLSHDDSHLDRALDEAQQMIDRDPRSPEVRRRLGDLLWDADRRDEAATAYREALRCDDDFALDPMKQMPARIRAELESRIQSSNP